MPASSSVASGIKELLHNPSQQLEGIWLIVNLIFLECPFFFFSVSRPAWRENGTLVNESNGRRGQLGGAVPPGSYAHYCTPWLYFQSRLNELFPLAG